MGGLASVGVLLLAGFAALKAQPMAWVYIGVLLAFELWLARRMSEAGRGTPAANEPPYHFTAEEAGAGPPAANRPAVSLHGRGSRLRRPLPLLLHLSRHRQAFRVRVERDWPEHAAPRAMAHLQGGLSAGRDHRHEPLRRRALHQKAGAADDAAHRRFPRRSRGAAPARDPRSAVG